MVKSNDLEIIFTKQYGSGGFLVSLGFFFKNSVRNTIYELC